MGNRIGDILCKVFQIIKKVLGKFRGVEPLIKKILEKLKRYGGLLWKKCGVEKKCEIRETNTLLKSVVECCPKKEVDEARFGEMCNKYETRVVYEELNREIDRIEKRRDADTGLNALSSLVVVFVGILTMIVSLFGISDGDAGVVLSFGGGLIVFCALVAVVLYVLLRRGYEKIFEEGSVSKLIKVRDRLAAFLAENPQVNSGVTAGKATGESTEEVLS